VALAFDKTNRLRIGHCPTTILAMSASASESRREFESDNFSFDDGGRVHGVNLGGARL